MRPNLKWNKKPKKGERRNCRSSLVDKSPFPAIGPTLQSKTIPTRKTEPIQTYTSTRTHSHQNQNVLLTMEEKNRGVEELKKWSRHKRESSRERWAHPSEMTRNALCLELFGFFSLGSGEYTSRAILRRRNNPKIKVEMVLFYHLLCYYVLVLGVRFADRSSRQRDVLVV
jgi:hypothetical protein